MVANEQVQALRRENANLILDAFGIPNPMRAFALAQLDDSPPHEADQASERVVDHQLAAADA